MAIDHSTQVPVIDQVAALPYRFDERGNVEVLLITSRGRGQHWIPPKGNLVDGLQPYEAAEQEAFEEAGVIGRISPEPIGDYRAVKLRTNGVRRLVNVTLFPLQVNQRVSDWPEKGERSALWFELSDAARVVREAGLAALVEHFQPGNEAAGVGGNCQIERTGRGVQLFR